MPEINLNYWYHLIIFGLIILVYEMHHGREPRNSKSLWESIRLSLTSDYGVQITTLISLVRRCSLFFNTRELPNQPHSARRPRTSRWRPNLDPYVSFPASLFVADVDKTSLRRRVRIERTNNVKRTPVRKRTSGKLTYGYKLGRPLDVTSK